MLYRKLWAETRFRFLAGVAITLCAAGAAVYSWQTVQELLPLASTIQVGGKTGESIRESIELSREFPSFVWSQWFAKNLVGMATFFAALLGAGSVLSASPLFTLSLPVSRKRLVSARAAVGLLELLVMVMVPSLLVPLFASAIGKSYDLGHSVVFSLCVFSGAAVFYALAMLLSTEFSDYRMPLILTVGIALVMGFVEGAANLPFGIVHVMRAEEYFRGASLPFVGPLVCAAVAASLVYLSSVNVARKDF